MTRMDAYKNPMPTIITVIKISGRYFGKISMKNWWEIV